MVADHLPGCWLWIAFLGLVAGTVSRLLPIPTVPAYSPILSPLQSASKDPIVQQLHFPPDSTLPSFGTLFTRWTAFGVLVDD